MRIGLCNSHVRNVCTFVLHEALTANITYDLCDLVAANGNVMNPDYSH